MGDWPGEVVTIIKSDWITMKSESSSIYHHPRLIYRNITDSHILLPPPPENHSSSDNQTPRRRNPHSQGGGEIFTTNVQVIKAYNGFWFGKHLIMIITLDTVCPRVMMPLSCNALNIKLMEMLLHWIPGGGNPNQPLKSDFYRPVVMRQQV